MFFQFIDIVNLITNLLLDLSNNLSVLIITRGLFKSYNMFISSKVLLEGHSMFASSKILISKKYV